MPEGTFKATLHDWEGILIIRSEFHIIITDSPANLLLLQIHAFHHNGKTNMDTKRLCLVKDTSNEAVGQNFSSFENAAPKIRVLSCRVKLHKGR